MVGSSGHQRCCVTSRSGMKLTAATQAKGRVR